MSSTNAGMRLMLLIKLNQQERTCAVRAMTRKRVRAMLDWNRERQRATAKAQYEEIQGRRNMAMLAHLMNIPAVGNMQ